MRPDERAALRERFAFRCGYCGVSEAEVGSELTVDHFQPTSRGGSDDPDNWVYACHACNEFKADFWKPDSPVRVLHPLRDNVTIHIEELEDGRLAPLTESGAFHIERLRLNRPPLVARRYRLNLILDADRERSALRREVSELRDLLKQYLLDVERQRDGPE